MANTETTSKLKAPTQAQIDAYHKAVMEAEAAQERLDNLATTMLHRCVGNGIESIRTTTGVTYRTLVNHNRVLNEALLRSSVTVAVWRALTVTSVSLQALDGLVKTGVLTQELVNEVTSYKDSQPFLRRS